MTARSSPALFTSRLLRSFPELVHGTLAWSQQPVLFRHGAVATVRHNRERLYKQLGIRADDVVLAEQVHGRRVRVVRRAQAGSGSWPNTYVPTTDGLVTNEPGLILGTLSADCVPVVAYDPIAKVVGTAHAGWRGVVGGVVPSLLKQLQQDGAGVSNIRWWLGPSIHSCCYNVTHKRDARLEKFQKSFPANVILRRQGQIFLDLQQAIVHQLRRHRISPNRIEVSPICTVHHAHRLASHYRQAGERRSSLITLVGLRDPLDHVRGRRVLVFGLGIHGGGVSTCRWLVKHGALVTVTDSQSPTHLRPSLEKLRGLPITYVLGRHRAADIKQADLIMLNPGVPREHPLLKYADRLRIPIENDAALFFRRCPAPIIGITGTKGKTTTTMMATKLLRNAQRRVVTVGHNQVPFLDALDRITRTTTVVAELSSWRLELLEHRHVSPHVAVITNVMPDHLNRYPSMSAYAAAKELILRHQRTDDVAILNYDNPTTRQLGLRAPGRRWWFSLRPFAEANGVFLRSGNVVTRIDGQHHTVVPASIMRRYPRHDASNVLAAISIAAYLRVPAASMRRSLRRPDIIPHRRERIASIDGVTYVNDTAATTPEAAIAGILSTPPPIILIGGGSDKRLTYHQLGRTITSRCKAVILFDGSATRKLLRHLVRVPVTIVSNMQRAVRLATALAEPDDTVLLSPGAASFGAFKHEFDRGDQFRQAVRALER